MTRRYYAPELPVSGGIVPLAEAEAQHAIRVMRVQLGDVVTLFDGRGSETQAVVATIGRKECCCDAEPPREVNREPDCQLHLGIALPKPDRAREMIERLTELGVRTVTPLTAERTQRTATPSLLEKLHRAVIEACKQSGRNQLLQIKSPQTASQFFTTSAPNRWKLIAHTESGIDPSAVVSWQSMESGAELTAAIGPEGGWTEQEVEESIAAGFRCVGLGPRIYRVETAAAAIAVAVTLPELRR